MKKVFLVSVLAMCLSGCTPEDRIGFLETQTQSAKEVLAAVSDQLPVLVEKAEALKTVLADPAINDETREMTLKYLGQIEAGIAAYKEKEAVASENLIKLSEAIATLKSGGTITNFDELQLYGQIGKQISTALPPPWNGYVLIGSSLLTLIAGIFGGKKAQQVQDAETVITATNDAKAAEAESESAQATLEDVVQSVDVMLKKLSEVTTPEIVASAKTALRTQSPETQAEVKFIKASA